jgi:hypothetical protein
MPINDKQKIAVIDINANTQNLLEAKLLQGYVILLCVNLQPAVNKLLICYATPDNI